MPARGRLPLRAAPRLALVALAACAVTVLSPLSLTGQSKPPLLQFTPALIGDLMRVPRGGVARGNDALYDVDLQLQLDGNALGWRGGYVFLYVLGNGGTDPSRHVGDFQGVDNIAAPTTWKIFELWAEQHFLRNKASALFGLYNLNSEFDVIGSSQIFLNSSFGIGPDFSQSGLNGPSIFPTTSLALRLKAVLGSRVRVEAAVLDGVPGDPSDPYGTHLDLRASDGLLLSGEVAYFVPVGGSSGATRAARRERAFHAGSVGREEQPVYDAKIALGTWGYTRTFPTLDPGAGSPTAHSYGAYLLGEAHIVHQQGAGRGLWAFGRIGLASAAVNQVGTYVGGGLSWQGPWRTRTQDEAGIAVAAARNGTPYMDAERTAGTPSDRWEVAIEASYRMQALAWLAVHPDVQYVIHPGMAPNLRSALLMGLRMAIEPGGW